MRLAALATGLVAAQMAVVVASRPDALAAQLGLSAIALASLAALERSVRIPVAGFGALFIGLDLLGEEPLGPIPFAALWAVGVTAALRREIAPWAGLTVAVTVVGLVLHPPEDLIFVLPVFFVAPFALGWMIARRREQVVQLEALHAALAAERERATELAVRAERARVAADSRAMLVTALEHMVARARQATTLVAANPPAARAALEELHGTGAAAMTELRRLLRLLHA